MAKAACAQPCLVTGPAEILTWQILWVEWRRQRVLGDAACCPLHFSLCCYCFPTLHEVDNESSTGERVLWIPIWTETEKSKGTSRSVLSKLWSSCSCMEMQNMSSVWWWGEANLLEWCDTDRQLSSIPLLCHSHSSTEQGEKIWCKKQLMGWDEGRDHSLITVHGKNRFNVRRLVYYLLITD